MLYHLLEYLNTYFDIPGINMMRSTTFRAAITVITSLLIALIFGKRMINYLRQ
jgi:phospho-N-acetylmuramoyl-pentapeptide-transferase